MDRKRKGLVRQRALVIVLSAILIQTNIITVFGYEVDDLREFSGRQRINTEEYKEKQNIIIEAYNEQMYRNEETELLSSESIAEKIEKKRDELLRERERLEGVIETSMTSNLGANSIFGTIKQIEDIDTKLSESSMKIPELVTNIEELQKQYEIAAESLKTAEEHFELGEAGERTKGPVKDLFRVYYTYGKMKNPYNLEEVWQNNGVYWMIPKTGSDIQVQWNGVVKKIVRDDQTWGNYIVVSHGNSLETSYSFLTNIKVTEGQTLNQYDIIGDSAGDYIYFEIILDGTYINPFWFYGSTGVNEYYSWLNSHPELVIDYDDLTDIKNYVKYNKELVEETKEVETKANTENEVHVHLNNDNIQ